MAIRVAVAGLGRRGMEWARAVRSSGDFELSAGIDADASARARAEATLGLAASQLHAIVEHAIADGNVDAVIVATPADQHVEMCVVLLAQRIPVLVEKPFAMRLEDAVRLVTLGESTGTPLLVAQNYRFMRAFRTAQRLVADGVLGPVGLASCQYYRVPHDMASSLACLPDTILWGMAVHHLDVLRQILQQDVSQVVAESFAASAQSPAGASLRAMLTFSGGTRATYAATYESAGHEYFEGGQEFYGRLIGERATLHIWHRWLVLCERGRFPRLIRRGPRRETEEQILLGAFARAIRTREPSDISGRENLQTMAVVEACLQSSRTGHWVNPQALLR